MITFDKGANGRWVVATGVDEIVKRANAIISSISDGMEANFIADILRLLFALSVAGVTIVAGFLLFKNIYGFSLPNLKETEAITEQSKEAVVITEESTEKKETAAVKQETEEKESKETESIRESTTDESTREAEDSKEGKDSKDSNSKQSKGDKESIGEAPTLESKKSSTTESKGKSGGEKSSSDNAEIGEGPKGDGDTIEVGPGISSP